MKPIDTLSDDEFAHQVQRATALPDAPAGLIRAATVLWPQTPPRAGVKVTRLALRYRALRSKLRSH
jgi:hypothetical protein